MFKLFKPRNAPHPATPPSEGAGKGRTGKAKAGGLPVRRRRLPPRDYDALQAKLLKMAPQSDVFRGSDFIDKMGVDKSTFYRTIYKLIKAKKVVRVGTHYKVI